MPDAPEAPDVPDPPEDTETRQRPANARVLSAPQV